MPRTKGSKNRTKIDFDAQIAKLQKVGRDIYKDLRQLEKSVGENEEDFDRF